MMVSTPADEDALRSLGGADEGESPEQRRVHPESSESPFALLPSGVRDFAAKSLAAVAPTAAAVGAAAKDLASQKGASASEGLHRSSSSPLCEVSLNLPPRASPACAVSVLQASCGGWGFCDRL